MLHMRRSLLLLAIASLSLGAPLARAADAWIAPDARKAAPKISLRDLDGHKQRLADLKGKVVVVNFWATWCGPCRLEMPAFTKVYAAYHDRGVEIVGAANQARDQRDEVRGFADALKISFPIWLEASLDHMEALGVGPELPATVVVDAEGRVAARIQGVTDESGLRSILDRLLSEKPAAANTASAGPAR